MLLYPILILVVICLFIIWKVRIKKQPTLEPPSFRGWVPLVGHSYKIMGNSVQMLQAVYKLINECIEQGGAATLYLGPKKVYCLTDPDDILKVMNTSMQKNSFFDFAKPLLGEGLFTADATIWKKTRKVLQPAFNMQVLNGFIEVFNSQALKLVDQFAKEVGKEFDQELLLRTNALETIYITTFGKFAGESESKKMFEQYIPLLTEIFELFNRRIQKFWLYSNLIYSLTPEKKRLDKLLKQITPLSNRMLEKKKLERKGNAQTKLQTDEFKPFMDIILDLAEINDLTDQQVQWEADTIIAAGHDTIATIMTFTLAIVGSHPETQEKAYNEIVSVMGHNRNVTKEDLSRLVFVEAVVKEVQRLHEVIVLLARSAKEDIALDKYTLKANHDCVIFLRGVHRHPMWGPDADQFRPERWLDKETLPDPKYYGAFGLGRRNCIGKVYAMMYQKILLTHLLRKYRVTSDISNMVSKLQSLTRPHSGHHITLHLRNKIQM